jgi:hypothetical protein
MPNVVEELKKLASVDPFKESKRSETFIGRPFYFDYSTLKVLVNDKWKDTVGGLPAGCFVLAVYDGKVQSEEIVLARVIGPTALPTDQHVIASMVDYYKEGLETTGEATKLDSYTRYEFMFSGVECRVLGTFFREGSGAVKFGADVENFFSAHNYSVYKPQGALLEYIVNFNEGVGIPGGEDQVRFGEVRYSSTRRPTPNVTPVPVYVSALDFIGKRTALFGMTRTGKSNTVKKLIECTEALSKKGLTVSGEKLAPVGQIIFDINGEYANPNQQDQGTAIFELFKEKTLRYSLEKKDGFKVMKLNFHRDLEAGYGMLQQFLSETEGDYVRSFLSIDLTRPSEEDFAAKTRWDRLTAAYRAVLHRAGFGAGNEKVSFQGSAEANAIAGGLDPKSGLTLDQAGDWFEAVWDAYETDDYFTSYKKKKGKEWADEDLKNVLVMLTRKRKAGGKADVSGYRKLQPFSDYHSADNKAPFEEEILSTLRAGQIVIIDLSQGDPVIQATYSDRICKRIFRDAMKNFVDNKKQNFVQLFFEEAHNLFPKKDDKDLSQIYNRIAKEGAKFRLGLVYATQEVSSISSNVLKNTQNWFVSHLNNQDELREIEKFYDFEDFVDSLRRAADRGFIRMKTYSAAYVVPVQIDRFLAGK